MKLSEMTTRQAAEAMVSLAAPVAVITSHPDFDECVKAFSGKKEDNQTILQLCLRLIPVFLKDCYDATISVLSVLTGKTEKELDSQPIKQTIRDVRMSWDDELKDFFS